MKIMCVDDEPLMLQMLEMAVREAKPDADIEGFDEPEDLLDAAKESGCDVAFLDIHMSGMTGVELAKELKAVNPKMNIIFVTGFSEYAGDAMRLRASGYSMKPVTKEAVEEELSELRFPITPDGKPVHFERSKSKEIFAYLVHRHGSSCTTKEIAAALFEDEPYDNKQQSYMQILFSAMMRSLRKVGAENAVNKSYNSISVNVDALDCDYYRFAELDAGAVNAYANEYMSQYYWADFMFNDF